MTATQPNSQALAFIGLGAMGGPISSRLVQAGFRVTGYDINASAMAQLSQAGGSVAGNPAAAAANAEALILLVASAAQVEVALFGVNGALETLPVDSPVMLCSTVPPTYTQALGARLQERGFELLDAPVSGGVSGAASGALTMMASGSPAAFEVCNAIIPVIASKLYRLGDEPGQGSTVKVINQLLVGVHHAATVEAMALAARVGANLQQVYDVIANSSGASNVFTNRVPELISGDDVPGGVLDIFVKDLGIVLEVGQDAHFPLPMASSAHQVFLMGSAAGFGQDRPIELYKMFEKLADIRIAGASKPS